MDLIIDRLVRAARRCERAARAFKSGPLTQVLERVEAAAGEVAGGWSGSWIGRHAYTYLEGLRPRRPGEHFDAEWGWLGGGRSVGPWTEYAYEAVTAEIARRAGLEVVPDFADEIAKAQQVFDEVKAEVLPALDAVLAERADAVIQGEREKVSGLEAYLSRGRFVDGLRPRTGYTRDTASLTQGQWTPPHIGLLSVVYEVRSRGQRLVELAKIIRHASNYLKMRNEMKGKPAGDTSGKVFIGHGGSAVWKDLRDFLHDTLGLEYQEYDREPAAGLSRKERLEEMLATSGFAFLVMTAEDKQEDGSFRARENVIHEAGLFQGRIGFRKAIVLLEDGCNEFSNIHGIGQIRFPKGKVLEKTEEIRGVLKREGMI